MGDDLHHFIILHVVLDSVPKKQQWFPQTTLRPSQRKHAEAEPLFRRAIQIREKKLGDDHHHLATTLNHLALLLNAQVRVGIYSPYHMACGTWA